MYNSIIKTYSNKNLKPTDVVAVGDTHGSILQIFYALKSSGLLIDVEITNDKNLKIKPVINLDFKNCPTVVFLGDYFHKSIFYKSFYLVHILLKIKKVVGDKLILLLGNHDVGQYVFEKNNKCLDEKNNFNKCLDEKYIQVCKLEQQNAKIKYIEEFINAIENNIFKISFVDDVGNFYSHTVVNSNIFNNTNEKTEIGFKPTSDFFKTVFNPISISPKLYNIELSFALQSNFNCCMRDYNVLINYINYLQDRPLTDKPINKNEILKTIIYYNEFKHDVAHTSTFHIVGHTPSFKRHPESNLRISEILKSMICNYDFSESSISQLYEINAVDTTQHGNILCCDSQALFSSHDISDILMVERKFTKYAIGLRKLINNIYEQPSFYIISGNQFTPSFGKILTVKIN